MSLFWTKQREPDRVIYTRSKKQKMIFYAFGILGFVLFMGTPALLLIHFFGELFISSIVWAVSFIALDSVGIALMLIGGIGGSAIRINLMAAARKSKKIQANYSSEEDTITIYR